MKASPRVPEKCLKVNRRDLLAAGAAALVAVPAASVAAGDQSEFMLRAIWAEYVHWRDIEIKEAGRRWHAIEDRWYAEQTEAERKARHYPDWYTAADDEWGRCCEKEWELYARAAAVRATTGLALAFKVILFLDNGDAAGAEEHDSLWNSTEADARRLAGIEPAEGGQP